MIHCPKCGAANRRGSRFCNECGELLPMRTALRCPMCGAMNSIGNVYCDKCNARLLPMDAASQEEKEEHKPTPIKGFSLPTIPLEEEEEQQAMDATAVVGMEGGEESWLSQFRTLVTEESEETEPVVEPSEPGEEMAGDWLSQLRASAVEKAEEVEPVAEPVEPVEIPDWLRDMGPVGEEGEPSPAPVKDRPAVVEPVGAEPPVAPTSALVEVPDWLRDVAPEEEAAPEIALPPMVEAEPSAPALAEVPDWLRDVVSEEEAAVALGEAVSPFVDAPPAAAPDVPEWLAELQPEPAPPSDTAGLVFEGVAPLETLGIEAAEAAGLARAEIPDWLEAMRPKEEVAEAAAAEGLVETEGLLEGLRGVLPLAAAIEMPVTREAALPAEAREASLARAQLLQSLLSRLAETPRPETRKQGVAMSEHFQRLVVGVTLLLSVLAILAWRPLLGGEAPLLARPGRLNEAGESLYRAIESVSAGDSVLVAFEYGPAEADELDMVAEPILRRLIERGADISIVSTRPEGLPAAARVWGDTWEELLDSAVPGEELIQYYEPDENYRPGDATGVSRLLADADTPPSLILVLTARPAPLRWWIEQVRARYEFAPPVVVGMSAAVEAAASPYLDASAGQLQGAISGLSGAAAYENRRGTGGQATKRLNAMAAGHVAIVVLMLVGAVIHTFIRPRGE